MNFNQNPVGFASGNLNPSRTPEARKRASERFAGDNNPQKRPEVRAKMSEQQKGKRTGKRGPISERGRKTCQKLEKV